MLPPETNIKYMIDIKENLVRFVFDNLALDLESSQPHTNDNRITWNPQSLTYIYIYLCFLVNMQTHVNFLVTVAYLHS